MLAFLADSKNQEKNTEERHHGVLFGDVFGGTEDAPANGFTARIGLGRRCFCLVIYFKNRSART